MNTRTLDNISLKYHTKHFPALLKTATVPLEDRIKIRELLKKPWNPYIFRHTSLTGKSKLINEVALRQDAGWAGKSQMHLKYVHYYGNEASNAILKARGIIPDNQQDTRLLSKPKECPNCSELNDPLGKFCIKCKMVLRYEGYAEALEAAKKKDQDMQQIKLQLQSLQQDLQDFKEFERNKPKISEIGRKRFGEEIAKQMKQTGKDLRTVIRERLDTDVPISRVKNAEKLPRI